MTNKNINGLTAATTPLAGTELVPVWAGATKKVTVANLTAGRAVAAASITVTGLTSTGSFNSTGVAFSASAPANSLTLDSAGRTIFQKAAAEIGTPIEIQANASGGSIGINGRSSDGLGNITFHANGSATEYARIQSSNASDLQLLTGSSGTLRVSISNTAGDVTVNTGNLVQGTAAKGINFTANTPAAGMTSQLLNWYEEGTWTAVVSGGGTAGTYELAQNNCQYTRIGRVVHLQAYIRLAAAITAGGTSYLKITGIPFAKSASSSPRGTITLIGVDWTAGANLALCFDSFGASSNLVIDETNDNAATTNTQIAGVSADDYILFSITYFI